MPAVAESPTRYASQEKRFTPKLQAYADGLASGLSQHEAAVRAGYKSRSSATLAFRHPAVQRYLQSVRNRVCAKIAHTVIEAMQEAADTMQFAKEKGNPMAYCKAVELRAKLSGLLIEKHEVVSVSLTEALALAKQRAQSRLVLVSTDPSNGASVAQDVDIEPKQNDIK